MDQVVALGGGVEQVLPPQRAGVVDQDVHAAEARHRGRDARVDGGLAADVGLVRERAHAVAERAAHVLDLGGHRVDRAGQRRLRRHGFRRDDDVAALPREREAHLASNAAGSAGDDGHAPAQVFQVGTT